jgi:ribosomal protein L16/L10AE
MMYQVQKEFIPGNPQIWVAQLTPEDPIYEYDNESEAQAKADELQAADPTGRLYRVSQIEAIVE